ncbi:MAG: hypothetical protein WBB34_13510 [Xanthobacteraceae bacterium]
MLGFDANVGRIQGQSMKRFATTFVTAAIALLAPYASATAAPAAEQSAYHITKVVPLGAPDRWDYVVFDTESRRVYVAHGDRVTVADGSSGAIIGAVEGMPGGTHGIAVSHATGEGYTDDGKAGVAAAFDLKTLKVVKRIKTEIDADGIVFDPASGHVFVIDGDSGKVTIIDPKIDAVVLSVVAEKSPDDFVALPAIPTQIGARTMAINPRTGRIYLVTADMTVNESAAPNDFRRRYSIKPGSLRLLFLDRGPLRHNR